MAEIKSNTIPVEPVDQSLETETLSEHFKDWVRTELVWYAGSFTVHLMALSLLLLLGPIMSRENQGDRVTLESKAAEPEPPTPGLETMERPEIGVIDDVPPPDPIDDFQMPPITRVAPPDTANVETKEAATEGKPIGGGTPQGQERMTGSGAESFGPGPKVVGPGIGNPGRGKGTHPGNGGDGYEHLGDVRKRHIVPTIHVERAINAALVWLANHQLSDGSWSLQHYTQRCTDATCTGQGDVSADAGATAMSLLCFLAHGDTHKSQGKYKDHIERGIAWLLRNQQPDGNLAHGAQQMMYSHGLATIALSEDYGLSGDRQVGIAAQRAVNFILAAQNKADGGWRYRPGDPGDTSVVGWQLMALKSAHLAGLSVGGSAFSGTSKWLDAVAVSAGTQYAYQPGQGASPAMTSVGLLCRQYLGAKREDPMLSGGMTYLMQHLPDESFKNVYYWYYATQVMHNMNNYEWETWSRKMRDLLVHTQVRDGTCANGSWDPANDAWGKSGGRVMQTALSTLTLEVYYRYLPLFKDEYGPKPKDAGKR